MRGTSGQQRDTSSPLLPGEEQMSNAVADPDAVGDGPSEAPPGRMAQLLSLQNSEFAKSLRSLWKERPRRELAGDQLADTHIGIAVKKEGAGGGEMAAAAGADGVNVEVDFYVEGSPFQLLATPTLIGIMNFLEIRDLGRTSQVSRRLAVLGDKEVLWQKWGSKDARKAELGVAAKVAAVRRLREAEALRKRRYDYMKRKVWVPPIVLTVVSLFACILIFPIFLVLKLGGTVGWSWKVVFIPYWIMLGSAVFGAIQIPTTILITKCRCRSVLRPEPMKTIFKDSSADGFTLFVLIM